MGCSREQIRSLLIINTILMLFLSAFTSPVVMAATTDYVVVTFDPDGTIDIDVHPATCAYGTTDANGNEESASTFTLYNNGTVDMTTTAHQNLTTDSSDLECDGDGTPGTDFYSIRFTSTTMDGNNAYISNSSGSPTTLDNSLAPQDTDTFKLTIYVGYINDNYGAQTTRVNFSGAVAS